MRGRYLDCDMARFDHGNPPKGKCPLTYAIVTHATGIHINNSPRHLLFTCTAMYGASEIMDDSRSTIRNMMIRLSHSDIPPYTYIALTTQKKEDRNHVKDDTNVSKYMFLPFSPRIATKRGTRANHATHPKLGIFHPKRYTGNDIPTSNPARMAKSIFVDFFTTPSSTIQIQIFSSHTNRGDSHLPLPQYGEVRAR